MARDRVNLLEDIALQPQARPTGAFLTAPQARPSKYASLAQGLSALNAGVQPFLLNVANNLTEDHILESKKRAEVWAANNEVNRKEFVKLVRAGKIAPEENPHFHRHLSRVVGSRVATEDYIPSVMLALDEEKPDTPEKLNQLIQSRRAEVLASLDGDTDAQAAFIDASEAGEQQVRREAIQKRREDIRVAAEYQMSAAVDEAIDAAITSSNILLDTGAGVQVNPLALQAVQERAEAYAQQTGDYEGANQMLMKSVLRAYHAYGEDEDVLDLADKLFVGPANQKNRPTLARTYAAEIKQARERAGAEAERKEDRAWKLQQRAEAVARKEVNLEIGKRVRNGESLDTILEGVGDAANNPEVQAQVLQSLSNLRTWKKTVSQDRYEALASELFVDINGKLQSGEEFTPEDVKGIYTLGIANGWSFEQMEDLQAQVKTARERVRTAGFIDNPTKRVDFYMQAMEGKLDIAEFRVAAIEDPELERRWDFIMQTNESAKVGGRDRTTAKDPQIAASLDQANAILSAASNMELAELGDAQERADNPTVVAEIQARGQQALTQFQIDVVDEIARLNEAHPKDRAKIVDGVRAFVSERLKQGGYKTPEEIKQEQTQKSQAWNARRETAVTALAEKATHGGVTYEDVAKLRYDLATKPPETNQERVKTIETVRELLTDPDFTQWGKDSAVEILDAANGVWWSERNVKGTAQMFPTEVLYTLVEGGSARKALLKRGEYEADPEKAWNSPEEVEFRKFADQHITRLEKMREWRQTEEQKQIIQRVAAGEAIEDVLPPMPVKPTAPNIAKNFATGKSDPGAWERYEKELEAYERETERYQKVYLRPVIQSRAAQVDGVSWMLSNPGRPITEKFFPGDSPVNVVLRDMADGLYTLESSLTVLKGMRGVAPDEALGQIATDAKGFTEKYNWQTVPYFRSRAELNRRYAEFGPYLAPLGVDETKFKRAQEELVTRYFSVDTPEETTSAGAKGASGGKGAAGPAGNNPPPPAEVGMAKVRARAGLEDAENRMKAYSEQSQAIIKELEDIKSGTTLGATKAADYPRLLEKRAALTEKLRASTTAFEEVRSTDYWFYDQAVKGNPDALKPYYNRVKKAADAVGESSKLSPQQITDRLKALENAKITLTARMQEFNTLQGWE